MTLLINTDLLWALLKKNTIAIYKHMKRLATNSNMTRGGGNTEKQNLMRHKATKENHNKQYESVSNNIAEVSLKWGVRILPE